MVKDIKQHGIYCHGHEWNKTLVNLKGLECCPLLCGWWFFHMARLLCVEYLFFLHTVTKSLSLPFPGKRETVSILRNLLLAEEVRVVHRVAVISAHAALIFTKVCWLSSLPRVMIDYQARPNFQDETRNHLKFTWFHVALQTKTWTRFLESLAKVHELLWQTQTAFQIDFSQFSHWWGPSFTRFRGHLGFQLESGKNLFYFCFSLDFTLNRRIVNCIPN